MRDGSLAVAAQKAAVSLGVVDVGYDSVVVQIQKPGFGEMALCQAGASSM